MRGFVVNILALLAVFSCPGSCFKFTSSNVASGLKTALSTTLQPLQRRDTSLSSSPANEQTITARDLKDHSLWITFDGFNAEKMNFAIELNDNFQATFSRGIESLSPGFWRVVKYEDGRETVEITHPILPEYMFFFDIWEPTILWRGRLDVENQKIVEGEVITNKKRFGLFPYTETLATWEAQLLTPGEKLPEVKLPSMADMRFVVSSSAVDLLLLHIPQ
jgi:hypothetical protein